MMKVVALMGVVLSAFLAGQAADRKDIFASGGFFVGCNYWAGHAGMYMWSDWQPEKVERELDGKIYTAITERKDGKRWTGRLLPHSAKGLIDTNDSALTHRE